MTLFGKDACLYYSTSLLNGDDVTADTATWTEQTNVADLTDNFTPEEVDVTTRATAREGWGATAVVLKEGEITWNMMLEHDNAFVAAVLNAFLNSTPLALMDLSGSTSTDGAVGLAANFAISWTISKPVKGVQTIDVTAKVNSYPEWVTVEV